MKKKILSLLLASAFVFAIFPLSAYATAPIGDEEIEYLQDGGYIVTTVEESQTRASGSKSGTKTKAHYDSNDNLKWKIVLSGQFTYTGSSSTCTSSSVAVNIYDSAYSKKTSSSSKSGNVAYGSATISRKVLGVTISTDTYNLTLTCDKNGNLS